MPTKSGRMVRVVRGFPALSVQQPCADLLVDGVKNIENRSQWTRFRRRVLIHAGLKIRWDVIEALRKDLGLKSSSDYETEVGAIIGMVEIVDVVLDHRSRWFGGPVGLVL